MRKITMLLGLGVGYVLGARAGRERYDQLKGAFGELKDTSARIVQRPEVQKARNRIMRMASDKLPNGNSKESQAPYATATVTSPNGNGAEYDANSVLG